MLRTTFNVSKMDCPSEERIIRMKLEGLIHIKSLQFDIPSRKLEVYHTNSYNDILAALNTLEFDTKLVSSEPADAENIDDIQGQERKVLWQVLAINFLFFILEMLTGFIANSMGLVADSLDMLADSIVYGLSLFAVGGAVSQKKKVAKSAVTFNWYWLFWGLQRSSGVLQDMAKHPIFS